MVASIGGNSGLAGAVVSAGGSRGSCTSAVASIGGRSGSTGVAASGGGSGTCTGAVVARATGKCCSTGAAAPSGGSCTGDAATSCTPGSSTTVSRSLWSAAVPAAMGNVASISTGCGCGSPNNARCMFGWRNRDAASSWRLGAPRRRRRRTGSIGRPAACYSASGATVECQPANTRHGLRSGVVAQVSRWTPPVGRAHLPEWRQSAKANRHGGARELSEAACELSRGLISGLTLISGFQVFFR